MARTRYFLVCGCFEPHNRMRQLFKKKNNNNNNNNKKQNKKKNKTKMHYVNRPSSLHIVILVEMGAVKRIITYYHVERGAEGGGGWRVGGKKITQTNKSKRWSRPDAFALNCLQHSSFI